MNPGCLIISLDFELMWGMIDVESKYGYGKSNVANVPSVISRLIDLFEKYGVHATFATVGMIMLDGKSELYNIAPPLHPHYLNSFLSPYENDYINSISAEEESLFFQSDLVQFINNAPGMEVATHTFCHYYCLAEGQSINEFEADIKTAVGIAGKKGIKLTSIIFPRNEVAPDYVDICSRYGIIAYRGNASKFFGHSRCAVINKINRICRFIDAYIKIGGQTSISHKDIAIDKCPVNVPASRMLRPFSAKLAFLEPLRLRRIRNEMVYAANHGSVYHLWWHPHNFGAHIDENFAFLEKVLKIYCDLHSRYGMLSMSMREYMDFRSNMKDG